MLRPVARFADNRSETAVDAKLLTSDPPLYNILTQLSMFVLSHFVSFLADPFHPRWERVTVGDGTRLLRNALVDFTPPRAM